MPLRTQDRPLKWKRILSQPLGDKSRSEPNEYSTSDDRFESRRFKSMWLLIDHRAPKFKKVVFRGLTFKACKNAAYELANGRPTPPSDKSPAKDQVDPHPELDQE